MIVFDVFYTKKPTSDQIVFFVSLLGVIGALSGLCYSGASAQQNKADKKIFRLSGDRFLHSFLVGLLALIFLVGIIYIHKNGIFGLKNELVTKITSIVFNDFALVTLVWSSRSFMVGFHIMRKELNKRFPLKNERLYEDLEKKEYK